MLLSKNKLVLLLFFVMRSTGLAVGRVRYLLKVAYDGSGFAGWQQQYKKRTVQGVLVSTLERRFNGERIPTLGASRTDSGVHARGQIVQADLPIEVEVGKLAFQLNRMLPNDIRVLGIQKAPLPKAWQQEEALPWHCLVNCVGKQYSYKFAATDYPLDPLERRLRAQVTYEEIDFDLLDQILQLFIGTHDFRAFANTASGIDLDTKSTIRTIHSICLQREHDYNSLTSEYMNTDGFATISIVLDGALYRMVRNIVGTSIAAANPRYRKLSINDIPALLSGQKTRNQNPAKSAPAQGLCLDRVYHDSDNDLPAFFCPATLTPPPPR